MTLPSLEDAFNSVLIAMETMTGSAHQINSEEIEGQTLLVISGESQRWKVRD
jgi:hypothetical protein